MRLRIPSPKTWWDSIGDGWETVSEKVLSLVHRSRKVSDESGEHYWRNAEFKRQKEVWDPSKGRYTMIHDRKSDLSHLDRFVFIARERVERDSEDSTLFIDVQSVLLRDVLDVVCRDIPVISTAGPRPCIPAKHLFHVIESLNEHAKANLTEDKDDVTTTTKKHVELLVGFIQTTFKDERERLDNLVSRSMITYDLLWALFKPNAEVYSQCEYTHAPRCSLYTSMREGEGDDGPYIDIKTMFLDHDETRLGESNLRLSVMAFEGEKPIGDLPCMPLEYHPDRVKIRSGCIEAGRKFVEMIRGHHHRQYDGIAYLLIDDIPVKSRSIHVRGRIMIDNITHRERNPGYPYTNVYKSARTLTLSKMSDRDLMICSWKMRGFSLTEKHFLEFAVCHIEDVAWSEASFDNVKIPELQKAPLKALTATYLRSTPDTAFKDLVHGKGRGVNFLLYGPPGVGKTLTAETLAESFKLPLYTVAAGQLGTDPEGVEENLTEIFTTASRWKSILLLDEADVFLSKREEGHMQLNALVSIFLRELEQYDGILFLTTNRVQSFDEAMISRIHLALKYEALKKEARVSIWKYFLRQATNQFGEPNFKEGFIEGELSVRKLNGREIRNAVFIARSLATYDEVVVTEKHIMSSIAAREEFEYDFKGAGSVDNNHSYF